MVLYSSATTVMPITDCYQLHGTSFKLYETFSEAVSINSGSIWRREPCDRFSWVWWTWMYEKQQNTHTYNTSLKHTPEHHIKHEHQQNLANRERANNKCANDTANVIQSVIILFL